MNSSVFEMITDNLTSERLDSIILQDPEYKETINEVDKFAEDLKACNLGKKEAKAVNKLICAYLAQNALYSKISYQHGFLDAVELLMEIGMIKQATK